jgi:hypothetical protein
LESGPESLDLRHLSIGELFVIWALRTRLARGPNGPVAGFRLAFGLSGVESALASFEGLFGVLQHHCRFSIWLHGPGCPCVSLDELMLAGVIAALQAGAAPARPRNRGAAGRCRCAGRLSRARARPGGQPEAGEVVPAGALPAGRRQRPAITSLSLPRDPA